MKNFHPVVAGVAGVVVSIEVEDGAMVGPGEILMTVDERSGEGAMS